MSDKLRKLFRRGESGAALPGLAVVVPAVVDQVDGENPLYRLLDDTAVLTHTLLALSRIVEVTEIVVVVREADLPGVAALCRNFELDKVKKVVCARGAGLSALVAGVYECSGDVDYIGVHDPLRPFITGDMVADVLAAAVSRGAAAPAVPVKDTIKTVRDSVVSDTPDRSFLYTVQSPHIVEGSLLKAALQKAVDSRQTGADLQSALELLGLPLTLTEGVYENIRVRSQVDIAAAEAILNWRDY